MVGAGQSKETACGGQRPTWRPHTLPSHSPYLSTYEDGTGCSETLAYKSDARELPRRKHTTIEALIYKLIIQFINTYKLTQE